MSFWDSDFIKALYSCGPAAVAGVIIRLIFFRDNNPRKAAVSTVGAAVLGITSGWIALGFFSGNWAVFITTFATIFGEVVLRGSMTLLDQWQKNPQGFVVWVRSMRTPKE